MQSAASHYKW